MEGYEKQSPRLDEIAEQVRWRAKLSARARAWNELQTPHTYRDTPYETHGNPRAAPDMFVVNINTLDDYDIHSETPEIRYFDGRNWEKAFAESAGRGR